MKNYTTYRSLSEAMKEIDIRYWGNSVVCKKKPSIVKRLVKRGHKNERRSRLYL